MGNKGRDKVIAFIDKADSARLRDSNNKVIATIVSTSIRKGGPNGPEVAKIKINENQSKTVRVKNKDVFIADPDVSFMAVGSMAGALLCNDDFHLDFVTNEQDVLKIYKEGKNICINHPMEHSTWKGPVKERGNDGEYDYVIIDYTLIFGIPGNQMEDVPYIGTKHGDANQGKVKVETYHFSHNAVRSFPSYWQLIMLRSILDLDIFVW